MDRVAITEPLPVAAAVVDLRDFDSVIRTHWPRVFRFVLASVRDADVAGTVTQDCFWRAYRSRDGFRGECTVQTWLMQIAVNLVRDQSRSRRWQFWKRAMATVDSPSRALDLAMHDGVSPEQMALVREQVRAVWQASETLPERQRTVFLLRFVEDMDLLEIATAMGISEGSVKVHLFRAVHTVRERVKGAL